MDNAKANKCVAQSFLFLNSDVTPIELYAEQTPQPVTATAIIFNATDAFMELYGGRGESAGVMDFTHDWSMAVTVKVQGQGVQGSTTLTAFCNGTSTLKL